MCTIQGKQLVTFWGIRVFVGESSWEDALVYCVQLSVGISTLMSHAVKDARDDAALLRAGWIARSNMTLAGRGIDATRASKLSSERNEPPLEQVRLRAAPGLPP